MFTKIIYGNRRYSRLHDEKGNVINLIDFFKHAPIAIISGLLRVTLNYRPNLPWISYSAIKYLKGFLSNEKKVLEFGSGMSTIWYAKNAKFVYSVEDSGPWYKAVKKIIKKNNIENIEYEFLSGDEYANYKNSSNEKYDLIMIDGKNRHECALNAITLINEDGIIYLDNSDKHADIADGDTKLAEMVLLDFAENNNAKVIYFTDFSPTSFFVQQGMLVKM